MKDFIKGMKIKTKTSEGDCARYHILLFKNDIIVLRKVFLSKDDLTKDGFMKAINRDFWNANIWIQTMTFKINSLYHIANIAFKLSNK